MILTDEKRALTTMKDPSCLPETLISGHIHFIQWMSLDLSCGKHDICLPMSSFVPNFVVQYG